MSKSTKQLAKELGLLRKRTTASGHQERITKTRQLFSYLVVLDFESTCWQDAKYRTQEIIEFPAVLLNTSTGELESEFQYYVQPQENPTLSEFCRQLTGISQDQVDQGIPLSLTLTKFTQWLKRISERHKFVYNAITNECQSRCTFVTWSDWDLGVCLQYEVRRKQLRKPSELNSWIDLRATYRKFYERRPKGLNGALQDLGLDFEGREHSGLHDSRNTAKLAYRMMCDGCVMNITKTIQGPIPAWTTMKVKSDAAPNRDIIKMINVDNSRTPVSVTSCPKPKVGIDQEISERACSHSVSNIDCNISPPSVAVPSKILLGKRSASPSTKDKTNNKYVSNADQNDSHLEICQVRVGVQSPQAKRIRQQNGFQVFKDTTCTNVGSVRKDSKLVDVTNTCHSLKRQNTVGKKPTYAEILKMPQPSVMRKSTSVSMKTQTSNYPQYNGPLKTPYTVQRGESNVSSMKRTPPMCSCGRRSKRKVAQNPGPNMGRVFFCCGATASKSKGCKFFKWDNGLLDMNMGTSPALHNKSSTDPVRPLPAHTIGQSSNPPRIGNKTHSNTLGVSPPLTHTSIFAPVGKSLSVAVLKSNFPQPDFSTPQSVRYLSNIDTRQTAETSGLQIGSWKPWSTAHKKTLGVRAGALPKPSPV